MAIHNFGIIFSGEGGSQEIWKTWRFSFFKSQILNFQKLHAKAVVFGCPLPTCQSVFRCASVGASARRHTGTHVRGTHRKQQSWKGVRALAFRAYGARVSMTHVAGGLFPASNKQREATCKTDKTHRV